MPKKSRESLKLELDRAQFERLELTRRAFAAAGLPMARIAVIRAAIDRHIDYLLSTNAEAQNIFAKLSNQPSLKIVPRAGQIEAS